MTKICQAVLAAASVVFYAAMGAFAQTVSLDLRPGASASDSPYAARANVAQPSDETLRATELAPGAASAAELEVGDELDFTLFDDVAVKVRLARRMPSLPGTASFLGETPDGVMSAAVIQTADGISASIQDTASGMVWTVYSTPDGVKVGETDSRAISRKCETMEPPHPSAEKQGGATTKAPKASRNTTGPVYVDLLIAYDNSAAEWAEGNGGVTNFATLAVAKMNSVLANTGLGDKFAYRLVEVMKVKANAGRSVAGALPNLLAASGAYAAVKSRREAVGADIVSLLIDTGSPSGTTGIGYSLDGEDIASFSEWAYNVCSVRAVAASHVLSHEVGHNMGAGHSDIQADEPGPQLYDYSSGYYFTAEGEPYHTIMAYDSDGSTTTRYTETPYFSSPSHKYKGAFVGDEKHDNTRTILNTYAAVSEFRPEGGTGDMGDDYTPSTWLTTREEAFAAARAHNKRIFLLMGKDTDGSTIGTKTGSCETPIVKDALARDYVLWYCNYDMQHDEAWRYFNGMEHFTQLPGIAVVDPEYEDNYVIRAGGYHSAADMTAFLDSVSQAPFPVWATDGESTEGVEVTWTTVAGASSYTVWRSGDGVDAERIVTGVTGGRYMDKTATPGALYSYTVVATIGGVQGPTTDSDTGYRRLTAPTGVTVGGTINSAIIGWDAVPGAVFYIVYRATSPDAVKERISVTSASTGTVVTDREYRAGTTYYYSVAAAGGGEWVGAAHDHFIYARIGDESAQVEYVNGSAVTYDANGGTIYARDAYVAAYEFNYSITSLPTPVLDGSRFDGWFSAPEGGRMITTPYALTERQVTFYAHWTKYGYSTAIRGAGGAIFSATPLYVVGTITNAAQGYLYVTNAATWRITSGNAATVTSGGLLMPVSGASGVVTVQAATEFWGEALTLTQSIRIVAKSNISGLVVEGPGLLDLYDEPSAKFAASLACKDGASYPVEARWSVSGAGNNSTISDSGELSYLSNDNTIYEAVTAKVSAVCGEYSAAKEAVVYGPGYVFPTEFDIDTNTLWPGATATITPKKVCWWRHGRREEQTSDMKGVLFGYEISANGLTPTYGDGLTFTVPNDFKPSSAVATVKPVTRPDRERYYQWLTLAKKELNFTTSPRQLVHVEFNLNGAKGKAQAMRCAPGLPFRTLPEASREGYYFQGWFNAPEGGIQYDGSTTAPSKDSTLYAQWVPLPYVVEYSANGGTGAMAPSYFTYDNEAPLPECTFAKDGYHFVGWALSPNGPAVYANRQTVKNLLNQYAAMTMYAKWEQNTYAALTLNANGGKVTGAPTRAVVGVEIGDLPEPERSGYEFLGWFTAQTGSDEIGEDWIFPGATTLYAHWKPLFAAIAYTSEAEAKAAAVREKKLLFVLFGAEWCPYTGIVKEYIEDLGEDFTKNFVCYYCDVDQNPNSKLKQGAATPTFGVYDPAKFKGNWRDGVVAFDSKYNGGVRSWVAATIAKAIIATKPQNRTWKYDIVGGCAVIKGCTPSSGDVYIPATLGGKPVTTIANYAFFGANEMTNLFFPAGVTNIGIKAFKNCSALKRVELPYELKYLGQASFQSCIRLTDVEVPKDVDYMWSSTFEDCTGLEKAWVRGATSIGTSSFANCKRLSYISLPQVTTKIKSFAFFSCESLNYINLPAKLNTIEEKAFKNTGIKAITIPSTLKSLGKAAFFNTPLAEVTIPGSVDKISDYCFQKCTNLFSVVLSEGVKEIGSSTFANDEALAKITFPSSFTTLGAYAFFRCYNLSTLVNFESLPNLTTIKEKAFKHCKHLTELTLGERVNAIPAEMCNYCVRLSRVVVTAPGGVKSIGASAFLNCPALTSITGLTEAELDNVKRGRKK